MEYTYVLIDPIDKDIRYVGVTGSPKKRLSSHINGNNWNNPWMDKWVKSLKAEFLQPIMWVVVESENWEASLYWEGYYAAKLILAGANIYNIDFDSRLWRKAFRDIGVTEHQLLVKLGRRKEYVENLDLRNQVKAKIRLMIYDFFASNCNALICATKYSRVYDVMSTIYIEWFFSDIVYRDNVEGFIEQYLDRLVSMCISNPRFNRSRFLNS